MATTVPSHESILRPETLSKQTAAQDAVKAQLAAKAAEAKKVGICVGSEGTLWDRMLVTSFGTWDTTVVASCFKSDTPRDETL